MFLQDSLIIPAAGSSGISQLFIYQYGATEACVDIDIGSCFKCENPFCPDGVEPSRKNQAPATFALHQNYPNPFNPTTKLSFVLSNSSLVTLRIYDVFGREVITLINKEMTRGSYSTEWNAGNIASGVYYYKLTAGKFVDVKKMVLIR
jgi:hypothetical protein